MTDVAKKEYKDSLKQKAEHLIIKGFPEKIVKLNELLETSNFQNRDFADVHQDLNIPVPPPAASLNEPNAKRPRPDSSEMSSQSSVDGTRVYALPNGSVPCNKPLSDLIHLVKPHIRELVEDSNLLKMWISFMIPKIEDGNNFGVSIQEDTLAEIQSVESEAAAFFDQISRYFISRAKIVSKVAKYPHIEDYRRAVRVTSLRTDGSCVDVTPHPHSTYRSSSTPYLSGRASSTSSVKRKSCRLELASACEDDTPRDDRTYREGQDTFRLSVASVSTTTTAKEERERNEAKKRQVFEQWLARKEREKREKARLEKLKRATPAAPTPEQREESYRRWLERKRTQKERSHAEEIVHRFRDAERQAEQRNARERAKEEKLAGWIRKKEEDMKLMKTREERRAARLAIEEKRKRAEGERAYRDWLRTSRNKPLPVPLNQGELSMRGSVSKMYVNPIPWQAPT